MKRVTIGLIAYEEPDRVRRTIASLRQNTSLAFDFLLLLDGPDFQTRAYASSLTNLAQSLTETACGTPACFNRLATKCTSEVLVLLESGSIVGPGWLEAILEALDRDKRNGLAGPSTNLSWNEQCILQYASARRFGYQGAQTMPEIGVVAELVSRHFKKDVRTLQPLHSLADFCYAVRREVIDSIGGADERYGCGPCWEMDYNIRAARAGFRGVWACSSYVHRMSFSPRRSAQEAKLFENNRRLYQDKFCALRLRRERQDYESHCRGDACEHFAPPQLIALQIPLPASPVIPAPPPAATVQTNQPLLTCIMPTRNRPDFVRQSIQYFLRQDYPSRELLILDDGEADLSPDVCVDPRIRYVRLPAGQTIGAKRNKACEMANGKYVAHWDDDDWYAPNRLTLQMEPLLAGRADITGFTGETFFDLDRWEFWTCSAQLHKRMFVQDVHGGTLIFNRRLFESGARYPLGSLAEDAAFLKQAVRRGARIERVPAGDSFVYLRHSAGSWKFACGQFLDPRGWIRTQEPACLQADRDFYAARTASTNIGLHSRPPSFPLVTCIMPTAGRLSLASRAVRYFQLQDYANRELLILDDGPVSFAPRVPPDPRIRYVRMEEKRTLGAKRNLACELAGGELIAHWDDDDWCATHRLSTQIAALRENPASQMSGLARLYFYDPARSRAWTYEHTGGNRPWVAGGTLCYWKTCWRRNPFRDVTEGEDTQFVWADRCAGVLALPDHSFYMATVHPQNTSPKRTGDSRWRALPKEQLRSVLGPDWSFYEQWGILGQPPEPDEAMPASLASSPSGSPSLSLPAGN